MTNDDLSSLREWLETWGPDGRPNHVDAQGLLVPIAKSTLRALLTETSDARLVVDAAKRLLDGNRASLEANLDALRNAIDAPYARPALPSLPPAECKGIPRIPRDGDTRTNAFVPLPDGVVRSNGGQRCDMLIGPCACGAWHDPPPAEERPSGGEGSMPTPAEIRAMHAHLTNSPTPTCKRCGKPRLDWQVFCGAACSAQWEAGDRPPPPVPVKDICPECRATSDDTYHRDGCSRRRSSFTVHTTTATNPPLPPPSVVEAIRRWGEAMNAYDDLDSGINGARSNDARIAARVAVREWTRSLRSTEGKESHQ